MGIFITLGDIIGIIFILAVIGLGIYMAIWNRADKRRHEERKQKPKKDSENSIGLVIAILIFCAVMVGLVFLAKAVGMID